MKKKILLITLMMILVLPLNLFALNKKDYTSMNLEQALTEEGIEHDLSNYKNNKKKITIYLFRGKGCSHCREFLTYLNSIVDEYGEYFNLESYEVWNNTKNSELMQETSSFLTGTPASGVPFIIIGDRSFSGYSSRYDESIKSAIKDLYDSKEKYDVFEEIEKKEKEEANANKPTRTTMVVLDAVFLVVAVIIIVCINNSNTKKLEAKLEEMNSKIASLEKIDKKEEKPKEEKSSKEENHRNKKKK